MRVEYETSDPETRRKTLVIAACVAWVFGSVLVTWFVMVRNRPTSLKIGRATYSRR